MYRTTRSAPSPLPTTVSSTAVSGNCRRRGSTALSSVSGMLAVHYATVAAILQKALYTTEKVGEVISRRRCIYTASFRSPKMLSIVLVFSFLFSRSRF